MHIERGRRKSAKNTVWQNLPGLWDTNRNLSEPIRVNEFSKFLETFPHRSYTASHVQAVDEAVKRLGYFHLCT